jgi:TonB family protein
MLDEATHRSVERERALAPRIPLGSALVGGAFCAVATFLILPCLHWLADRPAPVRHLRTLQRATLPPPPLPIEPLRVVEPPPVPTAPLQKLAEPMIERLPVELQLSTLLDGVTPAMAVSFAMQDAGDLGGIAQSVFSLAEVDVAPTPLVRLKPLYPPAARMRRLSGAVTLEFVVGIDGKTESIEVVDTGPQAVFVKAAISAIRRWRFTPATQRGVPVAVRVRQTVRFSLDGGGVR